MSSVHGQARLESLCRAYVECTLNIPSIFVTRDVSKFSGWLNAFATCRVKRGAYNTGRSVGRCSLELTLNSGRHDWSLSVGEAWRSAHVEHSVHVCDAGRVEIQLLVERLCFLSSQKGGAYNTGRSVGRCSLELALNSGRHDWSRA